MFRENRGQGSCKMCWFLWRHRLGLGSAFQVAEEQRIWRYEVHWNTVLIDGHFLDYILVAKCQLYRCCSTLIGFWLRVTGTQPAKQETSAICVEKATSKSFQVRCLHYFYCIYFSLNMHCIAVYCCWLFMCQHACRMQLCINTSYAMLYILWALQWTYDSWEVLSVALANAAAHHGRLSGRCVEHIFALSQLKYRILYCHSSHDHHEYDPTIYLIARFCCTHLEHFCSKLPLHLSDRISRVGVTSSSHQPHLKLIKTWR